MTSPAQQWVELMMDPDVPFDQVRSAYDAWAAAHPVERSKGRKVFERWAWFMEPRTRATGQRPDPAAYARAWKKVAAQQRNTTGKASANWTPMGPTSWLSTSYNPGNGRINVVAEDPATPTTIYAGAPSGGLWRSTDNGASWAPLFTELATIGVSGIAIHPANGTLFVATGDGDGADAYSMGVIKSTDGGASWSATGLDWTTAQVRTTNALRMHPTDPDILFCASSHGLWKTSDGANTWAKVAEGRFRDVEFKPGDPGVVYATTDQFFRSTDGGSTFVQVTTGLPPDTDVNRMQVAVTPADPNMVYVVAGRQDDSGFRGLYRSTNSGASFTLRSSSPNLFGYYETGTDAGGQSWYDMALAVEPGNAQRVYVGGINVWKSTDGGLTWSIKSHWIHPSLFGYTHADIHDLTFHGNRLDVGSDGGVFRSTNGGDDWTDLSAGLDITQFYRLGSSVDDASLLLAGAQDNGCNLLDGVQWTHVLGADGMECLITPGEPAVQYACQQRGAIYRSDDGGQFFNPIFNAISEEGGWVTPYVLVPGSTDVLIAGYKNLWRSDDRGDSWTQLTSFNTQRNVQAIAVAPSNTAVIYYANDLVMRRSINNGSSWQTIGTALPDQVVTAIVVDPLVSDHLWVSLSGYSDGEKVFESTDGGTTWTDRSGNLPNVPANTLVLDPVTGGLYVGTDIGVFYRDDQLSDWQPFSQGLPNCIITELEVHAATGRLRAATYGRGLWETDLFTWSGAPPYAAFTTSSSSICAGEAITFHDASIEAAPGWSWSFPGGSPAGSTAPSPTVTYATPGTYQASLTVANTFGADTYTAPITVTVLPNPVTVTVVLDNYPQETSWSMVNDLTGAVAATGGPYLGHEDGSTETATFCLEQGCYTFTIADSYGDGICCDQGTGSFTVTNPDLGTIASGGTFGYNASAGFCVSIATGSSPAASPALLDVRPVDADGLFAIDLPGAPRQYPLQVIDALGRRVRDEGASLGGSPHLLDLRGLGAGAYLIAVNAGDRMLTARVVVP